MSVLCTVCANGCAGASGDKTQETPAGVLVVCGVREGESRDKLGSLVGTAY